MPAAVIQVSVGAKDVSWARVLGAERPIKVPGLKMGNSTSTVMTSKHMHLSSGICPQSCTVTELTWYSALQFKCLQKSPNYCQVPTGVHALVLHTENLKDNKLCAHLPATCSHPSSTALLTAEGPHCVD